MQALRRIFPVLKLRTHWPTKKRLTSETIYSKSKRKTKLEKAKSPSRTEIINFLLSFLNRDATYLEIGVRNPADNFEHIKAATKYSVDPGIEFEENPVDFKMTSDEFFDALDKGDVLTRDTKFDVLFIDGLHLAEQVDKDIENALKFLKSDGFVVLHDCNPPSEWHARETYQYIDTPAGSHWNGTTWKAFLKWRANPAVNSCCIDSDWGVGILSKAHSIGSSLKEINTFYEYNVLDKERKKMLNLIGFAELKSILK
ncbi:MAG: class I SAM-dependent methyltransferase [Cyclobacteriaceae bacterium]